MDIVTAVLLAMSVPSAFTGLCFWLIQRNITKADKQKEEKEAARLKNEVLLAKCVGACFALGEATAKAVQRIPDANCNGDMHEALSYAQKIKHEQKDFFMEQGIQNII
jgi:phosphopantetheinyl transferase (holo-ACP synthase)